MSSSNSKKLEGVVFFDMYQTLVDVDTTGDEERKKTAFKKVFAANLVNRGVSKAEALLFQSRYDQVLNHFYETHDKNVEHHDFQNLISKTLKEYYSIQIPPLELCDLIYEFRKIDRGHITLYPGVQEVLEVLSQKYKLVLASYTQGVYSERELVELGIRHYFTACVFSSVIGYKKSSYRFYQECLRVGGVDPERSTMVGDNLSEDIAMAKNQGMHAVWIINSASRVSHEKNILPDATISVESLHLLPTIIAKLV